MKEYKMVTDFVIENLGANNESEAIVVTLIGIIAIQVLGIIFTVSSAYVSDYVKK